LSSQVLTDQALDAWVRYLRGHAALTREMNSELVAEHGLTINDYEVLLLLSRADERRMKRVELAAKIVLTASGITRLLDGLQNAGFVAKANCASDARITYAVLTDEGLEKLREAGRSHTASIRELFAQRFNDAELETLAELLGRLSDGNADTQCTAPDDES
jgi:DNA-binding MarR family transcriptional regulator